MPAAKNILIVGGGISGMTLAIALRRATSLASWWS